MFNPVRKRDWKISLVQITSVITRVVKEEYIALKSYARSPRRQYFQVTSKPSENQNHNRKHMRHESSEGEICAPLFLLNCDGDARSRHCRRKIKKSSLHCFASHPTGHASVSSKWVGAGTSHGPAHQEESQKHLVSHLPWWAVGKFGVLTPGSQNSFGNSTIHG